jgi:hypothetical protein
MPKRIQRKRTRGWRMPERAVYVGRPSKWGNSIDYRACEPDVGPEGWARGVAVQLFRERLLDGELDISTRDVRAELGDKDLACWCPLDQPCHADVLLELANPR